MTAAVEKRRKGVSLGVRVGLLLISYLCGSPGGFISLSCAARLSGVSRQKLEVEKHLKRLNKPPVKTIQVPSYSLLPFLCFPFFLVIIIIILFSGLFELSFHLPLSLQLITEIICDLERRMIFPLIFLASTSTFFQNVG